MITLAAALFAGLACWLVLPADPRRRLAALSGVSNAGSADWLSGLVTRGRRHLPGGRKRENTMRQLSIDAVTALASDLRSGQPMRAALMAALGDVAPHAVAAATWGGDVPSALRRDAAASGFEQWTYAAACWEVAEASGAGLATALDRLAKSARASEETRVQLQAHLAAPRATARMLATLPLIGIVLGFALGGDPLAWLLGTPIGQLCLGGGVVLTILGLLWVRRIARGVEQEL
jgi:tight adherence protein B